MRFEHVNPNDPGDDQPGAAPAGGQAGALARLARRREALRKASVEDFDLPGHLGDVVVRIQRLDANDQLDTYEAGALTWTACAQLLLDGCVVLMWRDDDGELHDFTTDLGEPAQWVDVARMSGSTVLDAQHAVLDLFEGNQQALIAFGERVDRWMASAEERDTEQLLGG